jgi:hypothetical protein
MTLSVNVNERRIVCGNGWSERSSFWICDGHILLENSLENAFEGVEVCLQDRVAQVNENENVCESGSDLVDKRHGLVAPDDHRVFHGMSHGVDIRPLDLVVLEEEFENESGNGNERWIAVCHVHFEAHEAVGLASGKPNEWGGRKVRP